MSVPLAQYPCQHLHSPEFLILAILTGVMLNLGIDLISISLTTKEDVEKEEDSFFAGGIASLYNHSGNQSGGSSENWM